ncbi:hypothetical protein BD413DRAFT_302144 [Trametes elegans]|nr:hypothetical protein BD413DRAFT_302144 [Trametes elegans]
MASPLVASHSPVHAAVPALRQYFSATVFQDTGAHSRESSRPSSSSSNASYSSPPGTSSSFSPTSSQESVSRLAPSSSSPGPSCDNTGRLSRPRPLPTPPSTPQTGHASMPPRPLPHPPPIRAQSDPSPRLRRLPLPTPPPYSAVSQPQAGSSPAVASVAAPVGHAARPSIQLAIPDAAPGGSKSAAQPSPVPTPLSPIAFNFPGPRDLRKRREEELERRMKDLGFVEAPPPVPAEQSAPQSSSAGSHSPSSSISRVSSDEGRDVVLLVEPPCESDAEELPRRNESRAAMRALFPTPEPSPCAAAFDLSSDGVAVDIQVEVVQTKAASRAKRRYSRKWVREKSGKRWTEQDFGEIISQLRKLR